MTQTLLKPQLTISTPPKKTLKEIVQEYLIVSLKLLDISEMVPTDDATAKAIETKELALLDQQADLLNSALNCEIESLDDAKAIMKLWHHEVVQSQMPGSLSAADSLVSSVYRYLQAA